MNLFPKPRHALSHKRSDIRELLLVRQMNKRGAIANGTGTRVMTWNAIVALLPKKKSPYAMSTAIETAHQESTVLLETPRPNDCGEILSDLAERGFLSKNEDGTFDVKPSFSELCDEYQIGGKVIKEFGDHFSIRLIETKSEFLELKQAWDQVSQEPMRGFDWHYNWWLNFGEDLKLQIYCLELHGKIIGIAPFAQDIWYGQTRLSFLGGGSACTDYVDVIVDPTYRDMFIEALASETKTVDIVEVIEFEGVSEDGPVAKFKSELSDQFWMYARKDESCWALELPDTWDEFVAGSSKSLKRKIRKAEKRLRSHQVVMQSTNDELSFEDAFDILVELHQLRFVSKGEPGVFSDPAFHTFLRNSTKSLCENGRAEIIVAYADDQSIGVQIYFNADSGPQLYQSGIQINRMDMEPGHLMFTYAVKKAIENNYAVFDFLRGDEPYKPYWGAVARQQLKVRLVSQKTLPILVNGSFCFARETRNVIRDACRWIRSFRGTKV